VEIIMDLLAKFEELVLNGSTEIDGQDIQVTRGAEINLKIYPEDGHVVIKVGSPPIQLRVTKLGFKKLVNVLRPTLNQIEIHRDSFKVISDNCPEVEFERKGV
jgi:hypothetical protein